MDDSSGAGGDPPRELDAVDDRIAEAKKAHARGWLLTPLKGKKPNKKGWPNAPPPDLATVERWAREGNVGLRTGKDSGVIVVDDDTLDGSGVAAFNLPRTVTVITGSGKRHHYFRYPTGGLKNSASKLAEHVDIRGDGGQVVYAGSIHPETGEPYRFAPGLSPDDLLLAELPLAILEKLTAKRPQRASRAGGVLTGEQLERLRSYAIAGLQKAAERIAATPEGSRNDKLNREAFTFGGFVAASLLDRNEAVRVLAEAATRAGLPDDEAIATIQSGLAGGEANPRDPGDLLRRLESRATATQVDRPRPVIRVVGGELPGIVDEAEDALLADGGVPIFQFGNCLVRLVRTTDPTLVSGVKRQPGSLAIRPIEATYLVERLTRAAVFEKGRKNGKPVEIDCPTRVAKTYLAREGCWHVPLLTGVIEAPTLRPDGSILDQPGYDEATGLFFDPGATTFPPVPQSPSKDEARVALEKLKFLIKDFPFVAASDHSAALAAMLTATVRRSLRTAPAFSFGAPKMSSGKSLLADSVAMLATGRPCAVMTQGRDDDENRKRMLALLLDGESVPCIDNIDRAFGDASMCAVLTQTRFRDRLLGASKMAIAPTNVTWLLTGNNLILAGDISTRVVPCDLDPHCERPEERKFDINLYEYIPAHRGELVVAALTVLRAYLASGRPDQNLANYARFEMWSTWVRSALVWLGEADPCEGRGRIEKSDPVREILGNVLANWHEVVGEKYVTTAEAIQQAATAKTSGNSGFSDALLAAAPGKGDLPEARKLGHWIKRFLNRVEVGLRLERGGERHHVAIWRVVAVSERQKSDKGDPADCTADAGRHGGNGELFTADAREPSPSACSFSATAASKDDPAPAEPKLEDAPPSENLARDVDLADDEVAL